MWCHNSGMNFEISSVILDIETIAAGSGIRDIARLRRLYGRGQWRKRKGICRVQLADGQTELADYIGTRQPASAGGNTRSNDFSERGPDGEAIRTACDLAV
jgi:hypothetical protein